MTSQQDMIYAIILQTGITVEMMSKVYSKKPMSKTKWQIAAIKWPLEVYKITLVFFSKIYCFNSSGTVYSCQLSSVYSGRVLQRMNITICIVGEPVIYLSIEMGSQFFILKLKIYKINNNYHFSFNQKNIIFIYSHQEIHPF